MMRDGNLAEAFVSAIHAMQAFVERMSQTLTGTVLVTQMYNYPRGPN